MAGEPAGAESGSAPSSTVTSTTIATLVGGVAVLAAGVVLFILSNQQVGIALMIAGAGELGVKGVTLLK